MGNIIGGGIFALPATVAPYGTISLLAFLVLSVGAVLLALLFGKLARRSPVTGGLYVYPRDAFGEFAGFLSAWSYWTMCWVSIAALAVAVVGYVDVLIPLHGNHTLQALVAMAALWLPAVANFAGTRWVGAVQVVSTILKFVPLLLLATIGLFFVDTDNFGPFNASGQSVSGALAASAALLLYSFLGVESAAVSAGEVRDPERTVGRASVLGTLASALVYVLGTIAVFGLVPHDRLVDSGAPFADAVNAITGGGWGGTAIALVAVASITGCLNGWILMAAQMPYAAARDGLFPAPFARLGKGGVPRFGVWACAVLGSLLIALNYGGPGHHVPRPRPDHHVHRLRAVPAVGGGPVVLAGPRHPRTRPPGRTRPGPDGRGPLLRLLVLADRRCRVRGRVPGRAVPVRRNPGVRVAARTQGHGGGGGIASGDARGRCSASRST